MRSRGESRPLHLWQIIHDAKDSVGKMSRATLLDMLELVYGKNVDVIVFLYMCGWEVMCKNPARKSITYSTVINFKTWNVLKDIIFSYLYHKNPDRILTYDLLLHTHWML